ncbi:hypothetical protein GGR51DRAFT_566224 [Nemania sp. FL0031]|nr:hypothetical protein GGR51DRAFT_566224 [Nemania sp. FL0031]
MRQGESSIQLSDDGTESLTEVTGKGLNQRGEATNQTYESQYSTSGGSQTCANSIIVKSDVRPAWDRLRKSCQEMDTEQEVPRKDKIIKGKMKSSRAHRELILGKYGDAVAYLCHTGHGHRNSCELTELERAEKMMPCPGSPGLFDVTRRPNHHYYQAQVRMKVILLDLSYSQLAKRASTQMTGSL